MTTKVGYHDKSGRQLKRLGGEGIEAIQLYNGDSKSWTKPKFEKTVSRAWHESDLAVVIHSPYVINLAGADELRRKSIDLVIRHAQVARAQGAVGLVVHIGSGDTQDWRQRVGTSLQDICKQLTAEERELLLIENVQAGPGGRIINHMWVADTFDLRLCLDTAHSWEYGNDPREHSEALGDRVGLVHANGSKREQGAHRDSHADIHTADSQFDPGWVVECSARAPLAICEATDGRGAALWLREQLDG